MEGIKHIKQTWGDFALHLYINNQLLNFNIKNKANEKTFEAAYSIDTLPNNIKINYETLESFLEQIRYIIQNKIVLRLKIRENGKQIVFGISCKIKEQQTLIEEVLITEQKITIIGNHSLIQLFQSFEDEKRKNQNLIEGISDNLTQIDAFSLKQSMIISSLTDRIQVLQTSQRQRQQNVLKNDKKFQERKHLKEWMLKVQEQLVWVQKGMQKKNTIKIKKNLMGQEEIADMGQQELVNNIKINYVEQSQKQLRKWTQNLFEQHLKKEHESLTLLITKAKEQAQYIRQQIMGIQKENQVMRPQSQKKNMNLNLKALYQQIQTLKGQLKSFIQMFGKQVQNLEVQMKGSNILSSKLIYPELFNQQFNVSSILQSKSDCEKLFSLFPKKVKMLHQLYKASQDNFQTSLFHSKCDEIPNTLTLVKTQYNKVIGGYTPCEWGSVSNGKFVNDTSSFLFSLTNMDKFTNTSNRSIQCHALCGPIFGGGNVDLQICNQSNIYNSSYANIGHNYTNEANYPKGQKQTFLKFSGDDYNKFLTLQWQVYQVVFE